jgi:hypothetical protein
MSKNKVYKAEEDASYFLQEPYSPREGEASKDSGLKTAVCLA